MSEEIMATNDLLTELARVRTDLEITRDVLAQAQRENAAERVARRTAETDSVTLLHALNRLMAFVSNGRILSDEDRISIHHAMIADHPGAPLLADLEAAYHALLSYAAGNSAPDLAREVADKIGHWIGKESGT
jgi:hypothetical protein